MSKEDAHRSSPCLASLLGFIRKVMELLNEIRSLWIASDDEIRSLMSWMGPETSGFEEAGWHERRFLALSIRKLNVEVHEVTPYLPADVRHELLDLLDRLDLRDYVPNMYGDLSDRWRQQWSVTELEKPLLRTLRLLDATLERGRAITIEYEARRTPAPPALVLTENWVPPTTTVLANVDRPAEGESSVPDSDLVARRARAEKKLRGRPLEVYLQYLAAVEHDSSVEGKPTAAFALLERNFESCLGSKFNEDFPSWSKALSRARKKLGEVESRLRADPSSSPSVVSPDEV